MNLNEFAGKQLFKKHGIPLPKSMMLNQESFASTDPFTTLELDEVVLKAQILSGKRGKGGGILFADKSDYETKAQQLFGSTINGFLVEEVLAEQKLDIAQEIYLAVTLDRTSKGLIVIYSSEGGMDIEEISEQHPDKIQKIPVSDKEALAKLPREIQEIAAKLVTLCQQEHALLAEINPLIKTAQGELIAADAKVVIDDNSLPQQASDHEFSFVELDGNIGVIGNGAGLVMTTLDTLAYYSGQAANFLDIGGGADKDKMFKAIDTVLAKEGVKGLLINIFGGITRCDQIAQGIADYQQEKQISIPMVVRLVGTNEAEGQAILTQAGIEYATQMNEAVEKVVELVAKVS